RQHAPGRGAATIHRVPGPGRGAQRWVAWRCGTGPPGRRPARPPERAGSRQVRRTPEAGTLGGLCSSSHGGTPMLFQHVAIAGLAHIDAPRRLSSDEINARLKPTLDRLNIRIDVLKDIAGIHERRLWDGEMQASDAATLAGVKALADAGIDPDKVGLLVNTSVSRDYLEPSTASIVSGNLGLPDTCQNFDIA